MNAATKIKDLIAAAAEQGKRIVSRPRDMTDAEFITAFKVAEPEIKRGQHANLENN